MMVMVMMLTRTKKAMQDYLSSASYVTGIPGQPPGLERVIVVDRARAHLVGVSL